jgi:ribose-phosphate pyrophosphokinase
MHLFAGSAHPALARALSKECKTPLGKVTVKRFSSGECYVKFDESVRGKAVYILQAPGQNPDAHLIELCLMCQAARLSFATEVHVILPQFPYARQDRVSHPRESISAKFIARMLEEAGASHIITLSLHSDQIQGFFSIPVDIIDTNALFAAYIRKMKLRDPLVVSPDIGGAKQAKKFADVLGADLAIMHKARSGHHQAQIIEVVGDVSGRTCIVFDDMIDTAGTIVTAVETLRSRGANGDIYVAATHPILSGPAVERLQAAKVTQTIVTDSIDCPVFPGLTRLPIAPLLAQVIRHIERGTSVTSIYEKTSFRKK